MIFHENRLLADDSHEISYHIFVENWERCLKNLSSAAVVIGALRVNTTLSRVAQSATCLATDASLTADPGVASSIPARSHTFMEIDHEIISMVILLPSAESFKKVCCQ